MNRPDRAHIPVADPNPYSPPETVSSRVIATPIAAPHRWLRRWLIVQIAVMVIALGVEAIEHETIVGSGPVFSLVGLVITMVALKGGQGSAAAFGMSAIVLSAVIVFLINYNGWSPLQGDGPITMMIWIYAAIAIPIGCRLVTRLRSDSLGRDETSV